MKTKKLIMIIAALAGFFSSVVAQQDYERFTFSIVAGPHVQWLHTDQLQADPGTIGVGFGAGLMADYYFQPHYIFSFGLRFNQTGGAISYGGPVYLNRITGLDTLQAGTKIKYHLQYVEIPLALKLMSREIGYVSFRTEFGLDPWINIKSLVSATDNNIRKEPYAHQINGFNLAYHLGTGINYSLGNGMALLFTLFYKNTFLDVTKDAGMPVHDNVRLNQAGITFGIVF